MTCPRSHTREVAELQVLTRARSLPLHHGPPPTQKPPQPRRLNAGQNHSHYTGLEENLASQVGVGACLRRPAIQVFPVDVVIKLNGYLECSV